MYLKRQTIDERDQETPRVWRAAIYLSEPVPNYLDEPRCELSVDQQRVLCRFAARAHRVEVLGEFVDTQPHLALRPGLHQALELAHKRRIDYLIISSLDRLADSYADALEVGWRLGHAGTIPMPAEEGN